MRNRWFCYPDHSFYSEDGAVFFEGIKGKDHESIGAGFYTSDYIKAIDICSSRRLDTYAGVPEYLIVFHAPKQRHLAKALRNKIPTSWRWFHIAIIGGMHV